MLTLHYQAERLKHFVEDFPQYKEFDARVQGTKTFLWELELNLKAIARRSYWGVQVTALYELAVHHHEDALDARDSFVLKYVADKFQFQLNDFGFLTGSDFDVARADDSY